VSHSLLQREYGITATLPIYLKDPDVKKITQVAFHRGPDRNFRNQLLVRLILSTGLRRSELANLKVEDIDLEERVIYVRRGKGRKDRIVLVDEETLKLLKKFLGSRTTGSVFGVSPKRIYNIVKSMAAKAEVRNATKISPHKLRHTFAIQWIQRGGDIESLRRLLGHSRLNTTQVYLDFDFAYLRQAYDRLRSTKQQERRMV